MIDLVKYPGLAPNTASPRIPNPVQHQPHGDPWASIVQRLADGK